MSKGMALRQNQTCLRTAALFLEYRTGGGDGIWLPGKHEGLGSVPVPDNPGVEVQEGEAGES